jgi:hypothetical protein
MLQSCKSNIFWRSGSGTGTGIVAAAAQTPNAAWSAIVTDVIPATACAHNCHIGLDRVAAGAWDGYAGDTGISEGTVYNSPMSGSTVPGQNDLVDVDPQFADPTRCIETWATSLDLDGITDAELRDSAYDYIALDPLTRIAALLTYVRGGFVPQNELIRSAGHDAGDIGAIAMSAPTSPIVVSRRFGRRLY